MTNYAGLQAQIDGLLGQAASMIGQPFAAYRITAAANGDYPTGWVNIGTNIPLYKAKISASHLESQLLSPGTMFFQIIGDMTNFLVGDVFQQTDASYSAGVSYGAGATAIVGSTLQFNGVALAWHPPVAAPAGAWVNQRVRIERPNSQPIAGSWRNTSNQAMPLVLTGGTYAFGQAGGTPSYVPAGIGSTERPSRGSNFQPGPPGMTYVPRYFAYLPPLPGYTPSENDRLIAEDGARYVVVNSYRQDTGFAGSQLSLDRPISQAT